MVVKTYGTPTTETESQYMVCTPLCKVIRLSHRRNLNIVSVKYALNSTKGCGHVHCASLNCHKVMKVECSRQVPQKLTANLQYSILDNKERKSLLIQLSKNVLNMMKQENSKN